MMKVKTYRDTRNIRQQTLAEKKNCTEKTPSSPEWQLVQETTEDSRQDGVCAVSDLLS